VIQSGRPDDSPKPMDFNRLAVIPVPGESASGRLMQKSVHAFCISSQRQARLSLAPEINELELTDRPKSSVTRNSRVMQNRAGWRLRLISSRIGVK
jgi:hypothetical protein